MSDHLGIQEFLRLSGRYQQLRESFPSFAEQTLLSPQAAIEAYDTDDSGWWGQCKREGLFPFAYSGDGDLLTLPADSSRIVLFLHDYANDPVEEAFRKTSVTLEEFIEKMRLRECDDFEWLYKAAI